MNVAVIGLGWWGPKLLRNFLQHPSYDRVYGFDIDKNTVKQRASELTFHPLDSMDGIWKDSSVDAVAVVTPVQTHYTIAKTAFEHGKHVLIAKPPAANVDEVEELGEIASKNNLIFMVDSTFVYNPAMAAVRDIITKKSFSDIRSVQSVRYGDDMRIHHISRIRKTMFANGIDVIEDLVFHDLSVLLSFIKGEVEILSVNRMYNLNPDFCDTAYIDLKIGNIPVHIGYSWTLPERKRELIIYTPDKFLVFDDLKKEEKVWIYNIESQEEQVIPYEKTEPLYNVVENFAKCIQNGTTPITGIKLMRQVMSIAERIKNFKSPDQDY